MKIKLPLVAIIIVAALCLINKEDIKEMLNIDEPAVCKVCVDECPCLETSCICKVEVCKCPKCIS